MGNSILTRIKALNEPLARQANRENSCKGRLGEGRFKCQAFLEEHAVLTSCSSILISPYQPLQAESLDRSVREVH